MYCICCYAQIGKLTISHLQNIMKERCDEHKILSKMNLKPQKFFSKRSENWEGIFQDIEQILVEPKETVEKCLWIKLRVYFVQVNFK